MTMNEKQTIQTAIAKIKEKQFEDAKLLLTDAINEHPRSHVIQNLMGACLANLNDHNNAVIHYKEAILLNPQFIDAYNNLAVSEIELGNDSQALLNLSKALEIHPEYIDAIYNISTVYRNMGLPVKAQTALEKLIKIDPLSAKSFYNLALILQEKGELDLAAINADRALACDPSFRQAMMFKAMLLSSKGYLRQAINSFHRAAELGEDDAKVSSGISRAYEKASLSKEALLTVRNAIQRNEDNGDLLSQYGMLIKRRQFKSYSNADAEILIRILLAKTITRAKLLTIPVVSLFKCSNWFTGFNSQGEINLGELVSLANEDKLLNTFLRSSPVADLEVENHLKKLRRFFLFQLGAPSSHKNNFKILISLSIQCILNEYIYGETEDEKAKVDALELEILSNFSPDIGIEKLYVFAAYRPLTTELKSCLLHHMSDVLDIDFLRVSVLEPLEEKKLKEKLPSISNVSDSVSQLVQEQYERNPYPKWRTVGLRTKPASLKQICREVDLNVKQIDLYEIAEPKILIAGCGTGQQSIEAASRYRNAHITAIDLSYSSLAYAKRMSEELGFTNIEYIQGDILNLTDLGAMFDVIECVGVLHHMEDPSLGLAKLITRLKPDGLLKLGLYSKSARKDVERIRDKSNAINIRNTVTDAIKYRQEIISTKSSELETLKLTTDFYSTSELIDLLFHVQEHRYDLMGVQNMLDENSLRFIGFEGVSIPKDYLNNSRDFDTSNLAHWDQLEDRYPLLFRGMYQFWCSN